jgi:hypothetical protein
MRAEICGGDSQLKREKLLLSGYNINGESFLGAE